MKKTHALGLGILVTSGISASVALACFTGVHGKAPTSASEARKYWQKFTHRAHPGKRAVASSSSELPDASNNPWGGRDASAWKPEAVLANAVSEALNDGYRNPSVSGVKDVLVSVPLNMIPGQVPVQGSNYYNRPYGDGQSNSHSTFGPSWTQAEPPLVATLVKLNSGGSLLKFRFHRSLPLNKVQAIEVSYFQKGVEQPHKVLNAITRTSEGDYEAEWAVGPGEGPTWGSLYQNNVAFVRPQSQVQAPGQSQSSDWYPIDFRDALVANSALLQSVPAALQKFGDGTLLDPKKISVQGQATQSIPWDALGASDFGHELFAAKYFPVPSHDNPPGIHNTFYNPDGTKVVTAVGQGDTVVIPSSKENPQGIAPFKMAYICFDPRSPQAEASPGVGAPSGGGWHEIGDPAETVINSLENGSVVFGYANGQPKASPPSDGFAYGLTDVAVIRKVAPGYAIVTAAGDTTLQEGTTSNRGHGPSEGRNYHWFIFNQTEKVCAMEWVHNCVPTQSNGLNPVCAQK